MPMAGIEDGGEENGLDTNKKLAHVGGSWNTAPKHPPLPGSQGNWHSPSGSNHELLTAVTEKGLRSFEASQMPRMKGDAFIGVFPPKPLQKHVR